MHRKKINDYRLSYINDLFGIKIYFFTIRICTDATVFGMSRFNNFLLIDATDRSKISSA